MITPPAVIAGPPAAAAPKRFPQRRADWSPSLSSRGSELRARAAAHCSASRLDRASAHQQHQFAARVSLFAYAVRLGDLGERERLRDRESEAPCLDQRADLTQHMDRPPGFAAAEAHPVPPRAGEVGDREDVLRPACLFDELGQHLASGSVERETAPVRRECAHPPDEPGP